MLAAFEMIFSVGLTVWKHRQSLTMALETANQKYAQLALALDDQDLFEDYLPYIEKTLNIESLIIENQEQKKQLAEVTHKLEQKVAGQVQEITVQQTQLRQLF